MKKYQICKNCDLCWGRLTLFYLTPRTLGHVLRHAVLNKKNGLDTSVKAGPAKWGE